MSKRHISLILSVFLLSACATAPKDDPLKNTKKLVREGHVSLYNNGAFRVPNTHISLIPPGPAAADLAWEMFGVRARQSFKASVERAAESVYIVSDGTKLSFDAAKDVSKGSGKIADEIRSRAKEGSTLLVYRSSETGAAIVGRSWEISKGIFNEREKTGDRIVEGSAALGGRIDKAGSELGEKVAAASVESAGEMSSRGISRGKSALSYAGESFVIGYAAVPSKMKKRAADVGEALSEANFAGIVAQENENRKYLSQKSVDLFSETVRDYKNNVGASFEKARKEFEGYHTTGLSLAVLRSMRWALQGIMWDATIEPAANLSAASVGYIGVNLVAFPTMVVVREGIATTNIAVQATWNTARAGYDLVAPSGIAAVAAVYGVADMTGSNLAAGTTAVAGTTAGYAGKGGARVASVVVKGGGFAAGKGTQYIGVPLASAGIAVGGGTVGTTVGGAGMVSGGVVRVAGETGSATTRVFGNIIAGTMAVGGTGASVALGTASGVYELSKAVVVPSGYVGGSGIVLGYGTMSHLAAHSVLAVSDASYMVLSLEGPRWVLYAVKGKTGSGEDLPVGAVVDLKKMQQEGEEIYYLPVSDEEMKAVVGSVYENLPEVRE